MKLLKYKIALKWLSIQEQALFGSYNQMNILSVVNTSYCRNTYKTEQGIIHSASIEQFHFSGSVISVVDTVQFFMVFIYYAAFQSGLHAEV